MSKIPVSALLSDFQRMYQERWDYVAGGSSERQVDCSGAFVWAFRQHGCKIYHGSNRIARTEVVELIPIKDAHIVPGMAAFKSRAPGLFSGYSLPESYLQDGAYYNGDVNDYYHIGLVAEDTSKVLNAQSAKTGFVSSDLSKGGWSYVAYLKQVDYGATEVEQPNVQETQPDVPSSQTAPTPSVPDEPITVNIARVTSSNGKPVKMRAKPTTASNLYWELPVGTQVMVTGNTRGGWTPIAWGGHTGYMMSEFLTCEQESESLNPSMPDTDTPIDTGRSWAVEVYDLTREQAEAILRDFPNANIFETHG